MNELIKLMVERLSEALIEAKKYRGSLTYATSYASAACAFNAFLNLLPDLPYNGEMREVMVFQLEILRDYAKSCDLGDFATWTEDVRAELVGERERRIRNHW